MSAPDGPSPVIWDPEGPPRSRLFDDVYYSNADGLAESRAVFLAGCGLPEAWRDRSRFTVGELGFGTGLNILALIQLWLTARGPAARLHVFSVEAFPMSPADARRALSVWPELEPLANALIARWPRRAAGFHRLQFDDWGVTLDLAVMDAADALAAWGGRADAWFLDGFSPARNPAMWSEPLMAAVAARSAPGARAATFTVAGSVRRGLEAAGFSVDKRPGFGRKRERLEARAPGNAAATDIRPTVAIVGAGVAGAALARAFEALGVRPVVVEAAEPGAGASGNPAGLAAPRLDAGGGEIARLHAQALARACDLYDADPRCVIAAGALQLEAGPKDASRFDRIARADCFEAGAVVRLGHEQAGAVLGEAAPGGLLIRDARVVAPPRVLAAWLEGVERRSGRLARLERAGDAWRLLGAGGGELARADIVCLANGLDAATLFPQLPLAAVRGQVSWSASAPSPGPAALWGGYAIPMRQGLLFGATHDRGDVSCEVRAEDHARNLTALAQARPALARALDVRALEGRASLRAATPDFLPLAGVVPADAPTGVEAGLYVLSGLGSRGFCTAPLLAEHVAALALGAASPLPRDLAALVDPGRFRARQRRRRGEKAAWDG